MPHITVKLALGRYSETDKTRLAEELVKDVVAITGCREESVSVAIEEVASRDWAEKVYRAEILDNPAIYKKPGYTL